MENPFTSFPKSLREQLPALNLVARKRKFDWISFQCRPTRWGPLIWTHLMRILGNIWDKPPKLGQNVWSSVLDLEKHTKTWKKNVFFRQPNKPINFLLFIGFLLVFYRFIGFWGFGDFFKKSTISQKNQKNKGWPCQLYPKPRGSRWMTISCVKKVIYGCQAQLSRPCPGSLGVDQLALQSQGPAWQGEYTHIVVFPLN